MGYPSFWSRSGSMSFPEGTPASDPSSFWGLAIVLSLVLSKVLVPVLQVEGVQVLPEVPSWPGQGVPVARIGSTHNLPSPGRGTPPPGSKNRGLSPDRRVSEICRGRNTLLVFFVFYWLLEGIQGGGFPQICHNGVSIVWSQFTVVSVDTRVCPIPVLMVLGCLLLAFLSISR